MSAIINRFEIKRDAPFEIEVPGASDLIDIAVLDGKPFMFYLQNIEIAKQHNIPSEILTFQVFESNRLIGEDPNQMFAYVKSWVQMTDAHEKDYHLFLDITKQMKEAQQAQLSQQLQQGVAFQMPSNGKQDPFHSQFQNRPMGH